MKTPIVLTLVAWLTVANIATALSQRRIPFHPPLAALKITSPYGSRIHPITGTRSFHNGVDLAARASPVYSILAGSVLNTGRHPLLGNFVTLSCSGIQVTYGHLSRILVKKGDAVYPGRCIGVSGRTGRVTAEHLHLSIKYRGKHLCPMLFLNTLASRNGRPFSD